MVILLRKDTERGLKRYSDSEGPLSVTFLSSHTDPRSDLRTRGPSLALQSVLRTVCIVTSKYMYLSGYSTTQTDFHEPGLSYLVCVNLSPTGDFRTWSALLYLLQEILVLGLR